MQVLRQSDGRRPTGCRGRQSPSRPPLCVGAVVIPG